MLRPATVTASASGLSRAPPHAGHGRSDMNCSTESRTAWDIDVACWRRSCGRTPSNQPQLPPLLRRLPRYTRSRRRGPSSSRVRWRSGQPPPRPVQVDAVLVGDHAEQQVVVVGGAVGPRAGSRPSRRRPLRRDHQLRVDLEREPEAGALRAGAVRRVERERPRRELGQRRAVLRAGELLGVDPRARGAAVAQRLLDPHEAVRQRRRRLQAVGEPPAQVVPHDQPVDDHLDRVGELLVERRDVVDRVRLAVDHHAREALGADVVDHVAVLALAARARAAPAPGTGSPPAGPGCGRRSARRSAR